MERLHSKRAHVALVGLGGTALLALSGWLLMSALGSESASSARATGAEAAGEASPPSQDVRRARPAGLSVTTSELFPLGVEQEYELTQSAAVSTSTGQAISTLKLHGTMRMTGLSAEPPFLIRGTFVGSVAVTASGSPAGDDAMLARAASAPFVLEFSADGGFVRTLGRDASVPALGRAWTSLGESLQLTGASGHTRWDAYESDAVGNYRADYEQLGAHEVRKQKRSYDSLRSQAVSSFELARSFARFALDDALRLRAFELGERVRVGMEATADFLGESELKLERRAEHDRSAQLAGWLAEAKTSAPVEAAQRGQKDDALDRARIAGMSDAEAFGLLEALTTDGASPEARRKAERAYVAFAAMLRQDPSMIAKVRARLLRNGPDTIVMLGALRDASTPAAQRLLAEMVAPASVLDTAGRLEAARCLSHVATPDAETVATLKRLRADVEIGMQATYGLGSALHRLKDGDRALADSARSALLEQLGRADRASERIATLTALGNAGDPATLASIRPYTSDASADVRAASAQALRRVPGGEADALLAAACADPAASVPESALDAIRERPASRVLADALVPVSLHASEFRVRAAAVNTLSRYVWDLPDLRGTLEHIAVSDPHADLRNTARSALALLDEAKPKLR